MKAAAAIALLLCPISGQSQVQPPPDIEAGDTIGYCFREIGNQDDKPDSMRAWVNQQGYVEFFLGGRVKAAGRQLQGIGLEAQRFMETHFFERAAILMWVESNPAIPPVIVGEPDGNRSLQEGGRVLLWARDREGDQAIHSAILAVEAGGKVRLPGVENPLAAGEKQGAALDAEAEKMIESHLGRKMRIRLLPLGKEWGSVRGLPISLKRGAGFPPLKPMPPGGPVDPQKKIPPPKTTLREKGKIEFRDPRF